MKDRILVQAWKVFKCNADNEYYIEFTHDIYLQKIRSLYTDIYLIAPIVELDSYQTVSFSKIDSNIVKVIELPEISNYLSAYKHFFSYLGVYQKIKNIEFDTVYSRFPSPFGWLQMFYFNKNRIVHYVGDPIDTILKNNKVNPIFKMIKVGVFLPELLMFGISSWRADKVVSNGHHIAKKLSRFNIMAKPLISSTLTEADFHKKAVSINLDGNSSIKLVYVGYLRRAKGVATLLKALERLDSQYPNKFSLTIIGSGEEDKKLKEMAQNRNISVEFLGHIDDRQKLNEILRRSDIFCFGSLSEGSPRVILEALANSLLVITTPVGSLPLVFKDYEDMLFFDFDNDKELASKIIEICKNKKLQQKISENSFNKAKSFKMDNFIQEAFNA